MSEHTYGDEPNCVYCGVFGPVDDSKPCNEAGLRAKLKEQETLLNEIYSWSTGYFFTLPEWMDKIKRILS